VCAIIVTGTMLSHKMCNLRHQITWCYQTGDHSNTQSYLRSEYYLERFFLITCFHRKFTYLRMRDSAKEREKHKVINKLTEK
jgi:hypothetical protein